MARTVVPVAVTPTRVGQPERRQGVSDRFLKPMYPPTIAVAAPLRASVIASCEVRQAETCADGAEVAGAEVASEVEAVGCDGFPPAAGEEEPHAATDAAATNAAARRMALKLTPIIGSRFLPYPSASTCTCYLRRRLDVSGCGQMKKTSADATR